MSRFSLEALFKGNDQVSAVVAKIQTKVGSAASGIKSTMHGIAEANAKIGESFEAVAHKAAAVGVAIGAVAAAGLHHIVHSGAEFEQSITNVGAVMGKTRSQITELEKSALSLGVSTQFSASEVSEAMEFMARKGFDSEEILQGIPGVLNAIAASGEGMAEVATVVGSSIRGFGLEAKEAGYVANLLAFTAEKTGAKITDMGTALAIAAPTAKALACRSTTRPPRSACCRRPASIRLRLAAPSRRCSRRSVIPRRRRPKDGGDGGQVQKLQGRHALVPRRAWAVREGGRQGRRQHGQDELLRRARGLRGDKAALGLERMAKSGEFDKLLASLKNTGNYAEKVAKIRLDTTMGSWKLLLSTIEVLEIKLFQLKGGALRGVIDQMNAWLQANQDLIVTKVADFIKGIADNMPKIVTWGLRILKIVAVFMAFSAAVKTANAAINIASFVAENPYVALALAVVAAIALIVAYWPEISAFFARLWASIKSGAAAVGAWFSRLWSSITDAFMSVWNPIATFFTGFWNGLKSTVRGVVDFIVGLWALELYAILAVVRAVVSFFRPLWEPVLAMFVWLWDGIKYAAGELWSEIVTVAGFVAQTLQAIWTPVAAFFGWLWGGIKIAALTVWDAIVAKARAVFEIVKQVWAPIATFFGGLWDGIASAFHYVMDGIISTVERIVSGIERAVSFVQGVGHNVTEGGGTGLAAPEFASEPPQVITPSERAGGVSQFSGEIAVRSEGGAQARVVKQPASGVSLSLAPSGGF
jgi:hypothetical protein